MEKLCYIFSLLTFLNFVHLIAGLNISPNDTELVVKSKQLSLVCTNNTPMTWLYPKEATRFRNKKSHIWTENGTYFNTLTIYPVHYLDTGYYSCKAENNNTARIYIYFFDENNLITSRHTTINAPMYDKVTIPCKTTSPHIRPVLLRSNGMELKPIEEYDPKIGYVLSTHTIIDSENFICASTLSKQEIYFTVQVFPPTDDFSNPLIQIENSMYNMTVSLNCSLVASPDLRIKSMEWIFPRNVTKNITVENQVEIHQQEFNTYYQMVNIYNLRKTDEGNYTCKVIDENSNCKITTHFLEVQELDKVHINITVPKESHVFTVESERNSTVEFIANVQSFPKYTSASWYGPQNEKIDEFSSLKYDVIDDESTMKLKIKTIKISDFGTYQLKITNPFLTKTVNFSLIVIDEQHLSIPATEKYTNIIHIFAIGCVLILTVTVAFYMIKLYKEKQKLKKIVLNYNMNEQQHGVQYKFPKEKLTIGAELGSGSFGVVKKAIADGIIVKGVKTPVAVKTAIGVSNIKNLYSELEIMIHAGYHLNVVNFLGACIEDVEKGELAVIVEYCKYGNLHNFIRERENKFVDQMTGINEIDFTITIMKEEENTPSSALKSDTNIPDDDGSNELPNKIKTFDLICWSYQASLGMAYLASRKIVHRDLAARNILLARENIIKIADFGLSKNINKNETYSSKTETYKSSKTKLPNQWLAIESLKDRTFSTQSDVWAFGVTMWELFTLARSPYHGMKDSKALIDKLEAGHRLIKPQFATMKIYDLMSKCWYANPNDRPSFKNLSEELARLLENPKQINAEISETAGVSNERAPQCSDISNPFKPEPEQNNPGGSGIYRQDIKPSTDTEFELTNMNPEDTSLQ